MAVALTCPAQMQSGRYFENIVGTTWQTTEKFDVANISELQRFGLIIVEQEVDSIPFSGTLFSFDEILKIEQLNSKTHERQTLLECSYKQDKSKKQLFLFIDDQVLIYSYLPVSTGTYVGFTKVKK